MTIGEMFDLIKDKDNRLEEMLKAGTITDSFYSWLIQNGYKRKEEVDGLYSHSLAVTEMLLILTEKLELEWQREDSPYIIGMFHDLCRIDDYHLIGSQYILNEHQTLKGHGEKSIMLLSQFMTLTEEEIFCIRYHMGGYETESLYQYHLAINKYTNVLYTNTAVTLAGVLIG